ncbi:hypothetical protein [Herpetosiphon geysericola]|uniref:Uncharacterized protein n=1 Tax=Herpetosiphon geysericola TaxID=70996 RepID=A0A0P6YLK2_9CHLR|nr:hypothetical protein [Herpetosiphon geysericola]KPL86136.1 hypothetical protein SE18_14860 [Herpetosiphon geysericola]
MPISRIIITNQTTITTYSDSGLVFREPNADLLEVHDTIGQVIVGQAANELDGQLNKILAASKPIGSMLVDPLLLDTVMQKLGFDGDIDDADCSSLKITFCKRRDGIPFLQFTWHKEEEGEDKTRFAWLLPLGEPIEGHAKSHSTLNAVDGEDV